MAFLGLRGALIGGLLIRGGLIIARRGLAQIRARQAARRAAESAIEVLRARPDPTPVPTLEERTRVELKRVTEQVFRGSRMRADIFRGRVLDIPTEEVLLAPIRPSKVLKPGRLPPIGPVHAFAKGPGFTREELARILYRIARRSPPLVATVIGDANYRLAHEAGPDLEPRLIMHRATLQFVYYALYAQPFPLVTGVFQLQTDLAEAIISFDAMYGTITGKEMPLVGSRWLEVPPVG